MNKDRLIRFGLVCLIYILGSLAMYKGNEVWFKNTEMTGYFIECFMYVLIGLVLGLKSFERELEWNVKVSDVILIFILAVLTFYPFLISIVGMTVMAFFWTVKVNVISAILLGYVFGNGLTE